MRLIKEKVLCMSRNGQRIGYTKKKSPPVINYRDIFTKTRTRASTGGTVYTAFNCSICCENIGNRGAYVTSCNHVFHLECIVSWYQNNTTCPMCRVDDILTPFGHSA